MARLYCYRLKEDVIKKMIEKMKLLKKKTKFATITLILLMTLSAMITFTPSVKAQVYDTPTFLFVTASPQPVGIGQIVYVGITFSRPTPTGAGYTGDLYEGITLQITDPTGVTTTSGPYLASPVAGVVYNFTPDKIGNYTLQAFYPGQVLKGYNPSNPAISTSAPNMIGSKMLPSESNIKTLTVQQDPVKANYVTPPLPTEYWMRPIFGLNWDWGAQIGANWFGLGGSGGYDASGSVQPSGTAPNSAHIMWTKATQFGGQPGYPITSDTSATYSSVSLIQSYFQAICILNGILYYNVYDGSPNSNLLGWRAVDVRTGQVVWDKPAGKSGIETIAWGQIINYDNYQEYGSNAFLYSSPGAGGAFSPSANWFGIYDAYTGNFLENVTNAISTSKVMQSTDLSTDTEGGIVGYYVSGGNLCMYNYTKLINTSGSAFIRATGTVNGSDPSMTQWRTPLPTTFNGDNITLSIAAVTSETILMRQVPGSVMYQGVTFGYQYVAGYDAKTGAKLWGPINQTLPAYEDTSVLCAKDGYYVTHNKDENKAWGYSLTTGQLLWGPTQITRTGGDSAIWRDGEIAYGKVYIFDLGGYVNAIDLVTGKISWTFFAGNSGYDTPFESYPIFGYNRHSISDGKLFLSEGVMYTVPLHPAYRLAINCTDGTLVWKVLQYSSTAGSPIGDGYLISWNSFDNQIYSFGKGPTVTTVTASPKVSVHGSSVLVEGTVMDTSGGTTQDIIKTRFANGLPAVSEGSMEKWMEYAYMQQIKPTNATGVDVVLTVLDPNNNVYEIGRTTSDASGSYKLLFTPTVPGEYTITAKFVGSESYYGSSAETAIGIDEAPAATPAPTQLSTVMSDPNLLPGIAAIIIAIAVGFAITILLLRKRP
jgi:hypothetical protein